MTGYEPHAEQKYEIRQSESDRAAELKYQVYLRTCYVVDLRTNETIDTDLHYLDAVALVGHMKRGGRLSQFARTMNNSGHASAGEVRRIAGY